MVIVRRSHRHSAPPTACSIPRFCSARAALRLLAYAKLRGLRGLLAILLSDDTLEFLFCAYFTNAYREISLRGHPERRSDRATPRSPKGAPTKEGRISRRTLFAQPCVLQYRLCTRNESFAKGLLLVIVWRSLRRKRLDFLLLASLDCKKLRGLRGLVAILLSDAL